MSDRELKLLKRFENIDLYNIENGTKTTDTDFHLSAHYDGKVHMAIGYGLDLYVNNWETVKKYLDEANEKSDSDFDFEKTYELSDEVSYTFETITKKYRTDFAALSGKLKLLSNPRLDLPFLSIDTTFSMIFMIERLGEAMPFFFDSPQAGLLPFCRNQSAPLSSDAFSASRLSRVHLFLNT